MSVLSLRLPDSLHRSARQLADKEHISINQLITLALAEKLSALMTDDCIRAKAERASQEKFEQAMAKVVDREPPEEDRL